MVRLIRISAIAVLLLGLDGGSGLRLSAAGETPQQVTTDTLDYCHQLAARVDQLTSAGPRPPETVAELSAAGKDMCARGVIRGGIMRLRSAIVLLLHPPPASGTVPVERTE